MFVIDHARCIIYCVIAIDVSLIFAIHIAICVGGLLIVIMYRLIDAIKPQIYFAYMYLFFCSDVYSDDVEVLDQNFDFIFTSVGNKSYFFVLNTPPTK